ncbi:MAG: FN3 domain-containing metallophosphoesterase family protein [Planctomycetota bacterium]
MAAQLRIPIALATLLATGLFLFACKRGEPTELRFSGLDPAHVRVIWTESPQSEALIAWSTAEVGSEHRVYFDREPHNGRLDEYAESRPTTRDGIFTRTTRTDAEQPTVHYHHLELEGLAPSTTYWLVVASDRHVSREFHFTTAPDDDRPFRLLSGSDSRSRPDRRRTMNRLIADQVEKSDAIVAFLHGGDYVYHGHEIAEMAQWLSDWEMTIPQSGRLLPIVPTRGNHEGSSVVYDEAFGWPGDGQSYFATDLGPNLGLVTLNTESAAEGDQLEFLRTTLGTMQTKAFRIAQYHQALYPAVKKPHPAREVWVPEFERQRLDLAMESDGHALKRTVPILEDKQDDKGVVYIGEGGYGVNQRATRSHWYLEEPGFAASQIHLWQLTVTPERLTMEAFNEQGETLDRGERATRGS